MVPRGFTLVAIIAIALLAEFHQGVALKCIQCDSLTNEKCSEAPKEIEATECGIFSTTTAFPPSTASETAPPSTPSQTTPPSTTSQTTPPSTTSQTTPPSTTSQTTPPSTTSQTTPPSTTSQTTPPSTTSQTTPANRTSGSPTPGPPAASEEAEGGDAATGTRRRRRNIMVRHTDYTCYKLTYKSGVDDVVERGCYAKEDACNKLKQGQDKSSADCNLCETDDCNASSRLSLGLLSIFAPIVLLAVFKW